MVAFAIFVVGVAGECTFNILCSAKYIYLIVSCHATTCRTFEANQSNQEYGLKRQVEYVQSRQKLRKMHVIGSLFFLI